jgi:multicomponent Na+:H+ antiporter subunit F
MTESAGILSGAVGISLVLLFAALFAALVRLIKGPSLPDRVMALDLVTTIVVGLIAVHAVDTDDSIYIRVAVVIALIGFVGTAAWAVYIRRGGSE